MWCYTTDPDKKWEYCDVKRCHATYSCQKGDPLGVRMNVTASETVLIPADIYGCDIIPWLVRLGTRAQQGHTRTACDSRTAYRHQRRLREPEATLEPRATFVRTLLMPAYIYGCDIIPRAILKLRAILEPLRGALKRHFR